MAKKQTSPKLDKRGKLAPLFAKLLESQFPKNTVSNQENDLIETQKFPNDNADLTNVPGNTQVIDILSTNKSCDTIFVTLKYPSDKDEFMTLKWPSDSDEDIASLKEYQIASANKDKEQDIVTLKFPSDNDEMTCD